MAHGTKNSIVKTFMILALIAGFFIGAYQAKAAELLYGPDEMLVGKEAEYSSGVFDASEYQNLELKFDYVAETLDTNDSFSYGWRGEIEEVLGIFEGLPDGQTAVPGDETGSVLVSLPPEASVSNLEVFVRVTASHGVSSDSVEITNLIVSGDRVVSDEDADGIIDEVDYCPNTNTDTAGFVELKPNHWRYEAGLLVQGLTRGGKSSEVQYSLEDTKGCGCEQIIEIFQGYTGYEYLGHQKFGCSEDLMNDFIQLVW